MEGLVTLNKKEQKRLMVLNQVRGGEVVGRVAAEVLGLSLRHMRRLMAELDITSIRSRSPQARGRIERLWGTFQDRLVSELRLAGARTINEANHVLWNYLPGHNLKFAVPAAQPDLAFRASEGNLDDIFCLKYQRTVGLDNVVRFVHHRLQVLPTNGRYSYARAKVEIHQAFDGSVSISYQGQRLNTRPTPEEATKLRKKRVYYVLKY